jgi:hypothetical protein
MQELQSTRMHARGDASNSVLTKLLSSSLGGNAYTLLVGAFNQGELSESEALLKHMQVCSRFDHYSACTTQQCLPRTLVARASGTLLALR